MAGFVPWPDDVARRYREQGLWRGVPLGVSLEEAARRHAARIAVVDERRSLTYSELLRLSRRLASSFVAKGLCDGAPILFQLPNVVEFAVAYVAALTVGAIPIACLPHHREAEIRAFAEVAGARGWLFARRHRDHDFLQMARSLRPELPSVETFVCLDAAEPADGMVGFGTLVDAGVEDDAALAQHVPDPSLPAVFQLSGGTTGVPKLIPRTHDDYHYNSRVFAEATGFGADDVLLVAIPVAHNFPLACPGLQGALLLGAKTVLAPSPSAAVVFPLVERERVTWIPAVPATVMQWTQQRATLRHDLASIRSIYVGGQRLTGEAARAAVNAFGPVIRQVFGMAEGLLCATRPSDPLDVHLDTQGRPVSEHDETRIVDDEGADVSDGEVGELLCRGPYTLRGYYRAAAHNATAFTADGFYRTGDMVRKTPSGDFVVEGRRKDMINRGGEKISAEEIEDLLLRHGAVANAAVVAIPDETLGERACACVVFRPGASTTLEELARFLRVEQRIAAFKIPERLEVFDALPLTGVGKVSKKDLREIVKQRLRR